MVSWLAFLTIFAAGCSNFRSFSTSVRFKPRAPIDTGVSLREQASLGIAPFTDQRPFIDPEQPRTYQCISVIPPGLDVHKPVDWNNLKSYNEGVQWDWTKQKTSDLINDILVEVFSTAGFEATKIAANSPDEKELLSEARSQSCELLLTGIIRHFQTAYHAGVVSGFFYLRQTIEFDVQLLRVKDGSCLLKKTLKLDREEIDAGHNYYSIFAEDILLNVNLPKVLNEMISDIKNSILGASVLQADFERISSQNSLIQSSKRMSSRSKDIDSNSNNAGSFVRRGNAYYRSRQYSEAISEYSKAIELDSNYASAYYNRGNAYASLSRFEEAKKDLLKAVELNPALKPNVKKSSDIYKLDLKVD